MTKQEILDKARELIAASSCDPELRMTAEVYVNAQDKESADDLVKALEKYVSSVDETIAFAESEAGVKVFGAEKAKELADASKKAKAGGEKYCICPACQAGAKIWENRAVL